MCGITGIISKSKLTEAQKASVRAMNNALAHRGPNSEGYFEDDRISVGMRRLSIIDLEGGKQPLWNEDRSIVLVVNGEIYNYVELRKELGERGHSFSTNGDCETIIHSYEEYGEEYFISKLRGMFAFCLYDLKKNRVILVRDRVGEKPLYVASGDSSILFSSELKSLLKVVPTDKRTLDRESLYFYFNYGYVHRTRTMFKGIDKLPPGHYMTIDLKSGISDTKKYWDMSDTPEKNAKSSSSLRSDLEEVDKIIIRSDVPVGISLSGGIDSSVIAALASRYSKDRLHAFSVGYRGRPDNDERSMARSLAEKLGLKFHEVELSEDAFLRDFGSVVGFMDEPIGDVAAYGYYAVSRRAKEEGVPVLLAGFGGDELFWGYDWVRKAAAINDLRAKPFGKIASLFVLLYRNWKSLVKRPAKVFNIVTESVFSDFVSLYRFTPLWMYMKGRESEIFESGFLASMGHEKHAEIDRPRLSRNNGIAVTKLLFDNWLVGNCIDLGDRMSMAHSVELRLPLLDYKLVESVMGMRKVNPTDYKLGYKYRFIEAVKDLLPREIFARKKRGFTPPSQTWVKHGIEKYRDDIVDGYLVKNEIMKRGYLENAIANPDKNVRFLYNVLVFEVWAQKYLS